MSLTVSDNRVRRVLCAVDPEVVRVGRLQSLEFQAQAGQWRPQLVRHLGGQASFPSEHGLDPSRGVVQRRGEEIELRHAGGRDPDVEVTDAHGVGGGTKPLYRSREASRDQTCARRRRSSTAAVSHRGDDQASDQGTMMRGPQAGAQHDHRVDRDRRRTPVRRPTMVLPGWRSPRCRARPRARARRPDAVRARRSGAPNCHRCSLSISLRSTRSARTFTASPRADAAAVAAARCSSIVRRRRSRARRTPPAGPRAAPPRAVPSLRR